MRKTSTKLDILFKNKYFLWISSKMDRISSMGYYSTGQGKAIPY
jgi:hypothetical protein